LKITDCNSSLDEKSLTCVSDSEPAKDVKLPDLDVTLRGPFNDLRIFISEDLIFVLRISDFFDDVDEVAGEGSTFSIFFVLTF